MNYRTHTDHHPTDHHLAVISTTAAGLITGLNSAAERLLGTRAADITGKVSAVVFHDQIELRRILKKATGSRAGMPDPFQLIVSNAGIGCTSEEEWTYVHRNGRRFPVTLSITAFPGQSSTIAGYFIVVHDNRGQLEAREMLRRQAELLDLANDAIFVRDLKRDTITYWNNGAVRLYGWSSEEALGAYIHDFLETVFPRPLPEVKKEFLLKGYWNGELIHTTKSGAKITVSSRWTLLRDSQGVPKGSLELNTDITEQKRTQEALKAAHEKLEQRVAERTAAVSDANERLRVLSRRLMEIQELERRAIARDLHDEVGQALTAIKLNLREIRDASENEARDKHITDSLEILGQVLQRVRDLALDLRPSLLDELGLVPALRWYVGRLGKRAGWSLQFRAGITKRPPPDVEIACFRLTQEALTNVIRHAKAKRVHVSLQNARGGLTLIIRDDGVGFDPHSIRTGPRAATTVGLSGMEERVRLAGGRFAIKSARERGTEIRATFPVRFTQGARHSGE